VPSPWGEGIEAIVYIDGRHIPWGLDVLVEHGVHAYARVRFSPGTIRAYTHEYLQGKVR
jgi:hypothetical protein